MLKDMKIGKKLIVTFMIVAIISSIGGIVGIYAMNKMNSDCNSALTNSVTTFSQSDLKKMAADLSNQTGIATIIIISLIIAALIVSITISIMIARSISKPITEMVETAQKVAQGNLSSQTSVYNSKNEIGQLSAAFSETIETMRAYIIDIKLRLAEMEKGELEITTDLDYKGDFIELRNSIHGIAVSLDDTLTQINQASEQVLSGAEQVSDSSQGLAQGATEQASSVEELSATITEISTHVKDNAAHAANANTNVNHVLSEIEVSNKHMDEMVIAMSQINESSSGIGKIIKTIEDIAFQTNILALNAAVEAARAGSAGKGFAVVADEVRNLASKSAEAAKNTTSLIENSMRQVESGTTIADETAKSLLEVVESAKVVSDTVEQISKASIRQSDAISQVTLGVEQISSVVQTNSATAEESAAASEELSGQAQVLKTLVEKFKLRGQKSQDFDIKAEPQSQQQPESECIYSNGSKY